MYLYQAKKYPALYSTIFLNFLGILYLIFFSPSCQTKPQHLTPDWAVVLLDFPLVAVRREGRHRRKVLQDPAQFLGGDPDHIARSEAVPGLVPE